MMKMMRWQMPKGRVMNKNYHLLNDAEFQRTVFEGEISPEQAKHRMAIIAARIKNQFVVPEVVAEPGSTLNKGKVS